MKNFNCSACGAALEDKAMDRRLGIVCCSHCDAIYDLASRASQLSDEEINSLKETFNRVAVPLPEKFTIEESPEALKVSWRWGGSLFYFIFSGVLSFVMLSLFGIPFVTAFDLDMIIFSLMPTWVFLVSVYGLGQALFTSTWVVVDKKSLSVRHGPVTFKTSYTFTRAEIEQLYIKERVEKGQFRFYEVHALLTTGNHVELISTLETVEQALWMEQRLEGHLGIIDTVVEGEFRSEGDIELKPYMQSGEPRP